MAQFAVNWAHVQQEVLGNAFGYTRSNAALLAAFRRLGGAHDGTSPVAFHFVYPKWYRPIPGALNVLMTMYEYPELPWYFPAAFAKADALVVPTTFVRDVFRPHFQGPIEIVPLGIDPALFPRVPRRPVVDRPFRFLWAGAENIRKGWREVGEAWNGAFKNDPGVELYMKTQGMNDGTAGDVVLFGKNVIRDARIVDDREMLRIYASADAFVFPSAAEGFGLTLIEAMATGLPCLTPIHTGLADFCDPSVVLPVKTVPYVLHLDEQGASGTRRSLKLSCQRVKIPDLIRKMQRVVREHDAMRELGERASARAQTFTWDAAAGRLVEVLDGLVERVRVKAPRRPTFDVILGNLRLGDALWCLRELQDAPDDMPTRVICSSYNRPAVEAVRVLSSLRVDEVLEIPAARIEAQGDYDRWVASRYQAARPGCEARVYSWDPADGLFGNFAPLPGVGVGTGGGLWAHVRREPPPEPAESPALNAALAQLTRGGLDVHVVGAQGGLLGLPLRPEHLRPVQAPLRALGERLLREAGVFVGVASAPAVLAALLGIRTVIVGRWDYRWSTIAPHVTWLQDPTPDAILEAILEARQAAAA